MARSLYKEKIVNFPEQCNVTFNNDVFTFQGPLGEQSYDVSKFKFTFDLDEDNNLSIKSWHGSRKKNDFLGTVAGILGNCANGVVKGFRLKLRIISKHFPIKIALEDNGKKVVLSNFLGAKHSLVYDMKGESKAVLTESKEFFNIEGINLNHVTQNGAQIVESCVRRKKQDPRIFVDGVYQVEKSFIVE